MIFPVNWNKPDSNTTNDLGSCFRDMYIFTNIFNSQSKILVKKKQKNLDVASFMPINNFTKN